MGTRENKKVSVVIPALNEEKAIEAVIKQTNYVNKFSEYLGSYNLSLITVE